MRVAFVGAHHDDAQIWAGGILQQAEFSLILTREGSDSRNAEGLVAAQAGGAEHRLFGDSHQLLALLRSWRAEVLITHWEDDSHPEHRETAAIVASILPDLKISTGTPRRFYCCDTYESVGLNGTFPATHIVDISDTYDEKLKLIRLFESQPVEHFCAMVDRMTAMWGARIASDRAEAFLRRPILGVASTGDTL